MIPSANRHWNGSPQMWLKFRRPSGAVRVFPSCVHHGSAKLSYSRYTYFCFGAAPPLTSLASQRLIVLTCITFPHRVREINTLITACEGKHKLRSLLGADTLLHGLLYMHNYPAQRRELEKVIALDIDAICVRTYLICNTPEHRTALVHFQGDEAQRALDLLQMVCLSLFLACADILNRTAT